MNGVNFNPNIARDQAEAVLGSVSAANSVKTEADSDVQPFTEALKIVASKEIAGEGVGEVSELYGTLQSASRTEDSKFMSQELSKNSRVKAVKEDYNQEEKRHFDWMMQEARRLHALLNKYDEVLKQET